MNGFSSPDALVSDSNDRAAGKKPLVTGGEAGTSSEDRANGIAPRSSTVVEVGGSPEFWMSKRVFDIVFSGILLVPLTLAALVLLAINPVFNRGPLVYRQIRMGRHCKAFWLIKFRTMLPADGPRGADDPLETDRITALGRVLRKTRIDELPQILNVLKGDMSLIGPRPDAFTHAKTYCRHIAEYRARHALRPGISGLAQVDHGYAEGIDATREKARLDLQYVQNAGFAMDARIFVRTLRTVLRQAGL